MRFFKTNVLMFLLLLIASEALAIRACPEDPCMLKSSAIVFLGKAVTTAQTTEDMRAAYDKAKVSPYDKLPDTYTEFDVKTLYKGDPNITKVTVYYNSGNDIPKNAYMSSRVIPPSYPDGSEQLISGLDHHGFLFPSDNSCGHCTIDSPSLKEMKASYDALDRLIAQYPNAAEFYQKKASLMEGIGDFTGAEAVRAKMREKVKHSNR